MSDIYEQHTAAFSRVSAWVILKDGQQVAKIAMKFPADGAGRLYAYVHWLGEEMVRGFAAGGGYDKRSAAIEAAARKALMTFPAQMEPGSTHEAFWMAVRNCGGSYWNDKLHAAGFTVLSAG